MAMDPFTMVELLLGDMQLTPGQLAALRALNTKYFTELYALQQQAKAKRGVPAAESPADRQPAPASSDVAALETQIASDIRELLTEEQRAVFDRNVPRLRERAQ